MKFSTIALALSLALVGCASAPPPQPRVFVDVTPAAPTTVAFEGSTWTMQLPKGWTTKGDVLARNAEGTLAVAVQVTPLGAEDDPADEEFGAAAILATIALKADGVDLVRAMPHVISGHPGSVSLVSLEEGSITMLQYAVGANKRGYVIACGGPTSGTIVDTCQPILDTFRLK